MKIGLQTIIFGQQVRDWRKLLSAIRAIGFRGVELYQTPDNLPAPQELERLLREQGLVLLGLAGGSIEARLAYASGLTTQPLYMYTQTWDDDVARLAHSSSIPFALHPHQYEYVDRFSKAKPILDRVPELLFIPDTGHLWLAGDDLRSVMEQTDRTRRIACVHLKDWQPSCGRAFHTYAFGFTELGRGSIEELDDIADWLQSKYAGWIVVEQDYTLNDPLQSIRNSWNWLHLSSKQRRVQRRDGPVYKPRPPDSSPALTALGRKSRTTVEALDRLYRDSAKGLECFYATLCDVVRTVTGSQFASLWEVSPRLGEMTLRAYSAHDPDMRPSVSVMSRDTSLPGQAIRERRIMDVALPAAPAERDGIDGHLLARLKSRRLLSIPILNSYNQQQGELLLLAYRENDERGVDSTLLEALSVHVAIGTEYAWERRRSLVLQECGHVAGASKTSEALLSKMLERIAMYIGCESASVLLRDPGGTALELVASTTIPVTTPPKVRYLRGEGIPGKSWQENEVILSRKATHDEIDDEREKEAAKLEPDLLIVMPMLDSSGDVVGVVRCRGRYPTYTIPVPMYSLSDEMSLAAVLEAFTPHLLRLQFQERRAQELSRVTHELRVPVQVSLSALGFCDLEMKANKWQFREDYIKDATEYIQLMESLISSMSYLRPGLAPSLHSTRSLLVKDIIAPAVTHVRLILDDRGFSSESIRYDSVLQSPAMFLDRPRMRQVFFNLLSNSIKYAFDDPHSFLVEMEGKKTIGGYELLFKDWGTGIEPGMEERIFLEGVRGRNAVEMDAAGDGIGLWVVREILSAHRISIEVIKNQLPTTFRLFFPNKLQVPPGTRASVGGSL